MNLIANILSLFKQTVTESSESHKQWLQGINAYEKGEALLRENRFEEALGFLDMAINRGFDGFGVYSARACCLQFLGFDLDAIDDFSKAIAFEPQDSNLYFMRSLSKGSTGDFHGRVADLQEAIRLAKTHPTTNSSHSDWAKEKGFKGGVADWYQSYLIIAEMDLEDQAKHESIRRQHPDLLGPDRASQRRATARRRTT